MDQDHGSAGSRLSSIRRYLLAAMLGVFLALFVIVAFGVVLIIYSGRSFPGVTAPSTSGAPTDVPGLQPSDSAFAILLMGYGGIGHDGAYLTDSMMVAIVDPAHRAVTLLSLPRDCWVPLVFNEQTTVYNKLNTAYAFAKDSSLYPQRLQRYKGRQGAGLFAMDTVARQLGIPISYYMALDFVGFRKAIDAVGGIDIDVPAPFTARYPANDDPAIDPSWIEVKFDKGRQHMDGERAIRYARAREVIDNLSEGSDFARSRRQQQIMDAFRAKLFQPDGLVHLPELMEVAAGHLDTNYTIPSIPQLGQLALGWRDLRIYRVALTNENYMSDSRGPEGTYILVPNSPDRSWGQIQAFANRLWKDPELGTAMANARIVVENDSGVAGTAGQVGTKLANLGYRIDEPSTGSVRSSSRIVNMAEGDGRILKRGLEADLKIKMDLVEGEKGTGPARIVLGIGRDYISR